MLGKEYGSGSVRSVYRIIIRSVNIDQPRNMMNLIFKILTVTNMNHLRGLKLGHTQGKVEFPAAEWEAKGWCRMEAPPLKKGTTIEELRRKIQRHPHSWWDHCFNRGLNGSNNINSISSHSSVVVNNRRLSY